MTGRAHSLISVDVVETETIDQLEDNIVIAAPAEITIRCDSEEGISINQRGDWNDDGDHTFRIARHEIRRLLCAIIGAAKDPANVEDPVRPLPRKVPTAAARQNRYRKRKKREIADGPTVANTVMYCCNSTTCRNAITDRSATVTDREVAALVLDPVMGQVA